MTGTKRRRSYPEARLQRAVVQMLMLTGIDGLIYFAVPNGLVSDPRTVANMKTQGLLPGVADLCIIIPRGRPHFLELKAEGGRLSVEQMAFADCCRLSRVPYAVSDNIEDAICVLRSWGVLQDEACGKWGRAKSHGALVSKRLDPNIEAWMRRRNDGAMS